MAFGSYEPKKETNPTKFDSQAGWYPQPTLTVPIRYADGAFPPIRVHQCGLTSVQTAEALHPRSASTEIECAISMACGARVLPYSVRHVVPPWRGVSYWMRVDCLPPCAGRAIGYLAKAVARVVGARLHCALVCARVDAGWAWRIGFHAIIPALGAGVVSRNYLESFPRLSPRMLRCSSSP